MLPLVVGMFVFPMFIACQAGQSKTQKQPPAKEPATSAASPASQKTDSATTTAGATGKIIVFYFHGNARCPTCHNLENYARSEIESGFADAIKKGSLEWRTVNVEIPGNEHFNDDYKLYTKSVIVSTIKDGKESSWKNLDKIWQLVHEESSYRAYIRNEVKACLEGKCL